MCVCARTRLFVCSRVAPVRCFPFAATFVGIVAHRCRCVAAVLQSTCCRCGQYCTTAVLLVSVRAYCGKVQHCPHGSLVCLYLLLHVRSCFQWRLLFLTLIVLTAQPIAVRPRTNHAGGALGSGRCSRARDREQGDREGQGGRQGEGNPFA